MTIVSRKTLDDVDVFAKFFGIDIDESRHIFRAAADQSADEFSTTMAHLANAVRSDARFGTTARIRAQISDKKRTANGR